MSIIGASAIEHVLSPEDRFSEVLFGIIMTLSIAGTMSVVTEGNQEVKTMLLSILGCNVAWGGIDGIFYLFGTISDRGREHALCNLVRNTPDPEVARAALEEVLLSSLADALQPEEVVAIQRRLAKLPESAGGKVLTMEDVLGAVAVFVLVVLSCVPLIIPFLFMSDPLSALRVSNAIAIVMLSFGGYRYARFAGLSKITTGLVMVVLGVAMVGITIALGG